MRSRHIVSFQFFGLILIAFASNPAFALQDRPVPRTWYVAVDGNDDASGSQSDPFATIQYGIDMAIDGDTVLIADGTYTGVGNTEVAVPNRAITIRSIADDPGSCIVDCDDGGIGDRYGFTFDKHVGNATVLRGIAITGGYAETDTMGAGIHLESDWLDYGASPTIVLCNISRNAGHGLLQRGGYLNYVIRDCTFEANLGCGVNSEYSLYATNFSITGSSFIDNVSHGIYINYVHGHVTIADCVIFGNGSSGIYFGGDPVSLNVNNCIIRDNAGYGIYADGGPGKNDVPISDLSREWFLVALNNVQILRNGLGGVQGHEYATVSAANSEITGNGGPGIQHNIFVESIIDQTLISDNLGSGIVAENYSAYAFTVVGSTVANNVGRGIVLGDGPLILYNVIIAHNNGIAVDQRDYGLGQYSNVDLFGNGGGDWVPEISDRLGVNCNISSDPLFCGDQNPDSPYSLSAASLCAAENNAECGQIGAYGIGCPVISQQVASLGLSPTESGAIACDETSSLNCHYTPGAETPPLKGYSIRVMADSSVTFAPAGLTVYTLPPGAQAFYQVYQNAPNDYTVDYTILGADTQGITTAEDLFSIAFHGTDDGIATVAITHVDFRDLQNQPFVVEYSTPATIIVDCCPPQPVTAVTAEPGHQKVTLTWTDPTDLDLASIKILRGMWQDLNGNSAYPLYGRLAGSSPPTRPATLEAALASGRWTQIAALAPETGTFTDSVAARAIYYYELFAVDEVGNASAPAQEADRATNYWLGDVAPGEGDGYINTIDMSVLGDCYGIPWGHPSFSAVADVGPTDDAIGTGIPIPDGLVAFDDLMIFGQNYGEVVPGTSPPRVFADAQLVWRQESEREWSCRLAQSCLGLKGLRVTADLPAGVGMSLMAGALIAEQSGPVFLQNAGEELDVGICMLGQNLCFEGEGELFRVVLTGLAELGGATFEARSVENGRLEATTTTEVADAVPRNFAASPNFPNPFNVSTTIGFDLPEPQRAEVAVYSIDGRRVRKLLSQQLPAGRHTVQWNGTDDRGGVMASGIYFYCIEAGPYRAMQKMVLAK